jgi:UDP-N-acetylglucosamine 2-epimerase (non-hydrolysing)
VPEEVNRRIIDHCSDVLMPYTERSRMNLLREGIEGRRVFVTGNPILEVIEHHRDEIKRSNVLQRLGLEAQKYFLVTMHRTENVDIESRLRSLIESLESLAGLYSLPVICSAHPRTLSLMQKFGIDVAAHGAIRFCEPFGLFDFVALEKNAFCVLSDSGTVQEECCIFHVPNVTIRDVTERPETLECGSNILSGVDSASVLRCVRTVLAAEREWQVPPEYLAAHVSDTVVKILAGYHERPYAP